MPELGDRAQCGLPLRVRGHGACVGNTLKRRPSTDFDELAQQIDRDAAGEAANARGQQSGADLHCEGAFELVQPGRYSRDCRRPNFFCYAPSTVKVIEKSVIGSRVTLPRLQPRLSNERKQLRRSGAYSDELTRVVLED